MSLVHHTRRPGGDQGGPRGYLVTLALITMLWAVACGLVLVGVVMVLGDQIVAGGLIAALGIAGLSLLTRAVRAS